jgi:FkbM family methyltransferase
LESIFRQGDYRGKTAKVCHRKDTQVRIWKEFSRLWNQRGEYSSSSGWLLSFYNRLLNSRIGWHLPGRGKICRVKLRSEKFPVFLRLGTTDWLVLEELIFNHGYDAAFQYQPQKVMTVLDLGSNIGLSLRIWASRFPEARIIGVEPDLGNLRVCTANVSTTGQAARVQLIWGCAAASERAAYMDSRLGEWAMRMQDTASDSNAVRVEGLPVPEILRRANQQGDIDFMKCDIEGAEQELFRSCADWIGRVRTLLVELHAPYTTKQFLADIEQNGGKFEAHVLAEAEAYGQIILRSRDLSC